ncbi:arginyltransferase [Marinobacter lutaoensis]|jgi:arginine-tRNA-protein transferase|uniref:arginyltransferase n=1 Tax=Marinobacter lutaoensis TaxID=135739 RepID=UPI000C6A0051|nr:arginyltransferase [Marinobacter lutaoensis]MBI42677.1 arginyltransferase [Oceanospirillales bacterium]NVD35397.1 arginyltransferase [Marinobacter lutaoensis]|tara:strand:- start:346 stop:1059 length:714 start_codon:yes stop_codon:yes gene_type:complete
MSNLRTLVFFATPPHACSYLPDREATTMFVDPRARIDKRLYSQLTALGFRRSGSHYYRPHCERCHACIPVRLQVQQFRPDRGLRRVFKRNQDLTCELVPTRFSEEYYALYARYIEQRHSDGDMYPPSREQFISFLVDGATDSWFLEMRLNGTLVGLAAIDVLDDGLSAIYTTFEPELEERSLGTYAILWQVEEARRRDLPHVYLGYWIKQCRKMNYKTRFHPLEALRDGQWRVMEPN